MNIKNIITISVQVLFSLAILAAGLTKLITPYEDLNSQMAWTQAVPAFVVKLIAVLEILGVIGLNLPFLLKKHKRIVPLSAAALALTMLGAVLTHLLLSESIVAAFVLFLMAVYLTYARKGLWKEF